MSSGSLALGLSYYGFTPMHALVGGSLIGAATLARMAIAGKVRIITSLPVCIVVRSLCVC